MTTPEPPYDAAAAFAPVRRVTVGDHEMGGGGPLFVIAGPCVIESRDHALRMAAEIKDVVEGLGLPYCFKSSYDKANRSSGTSYRGPGVAEGMEILGEVRESVGVPILTDVHEIEQVGPAAEVADILQMPAFLCRQTDLLAALARSGRTVNIKKGQFLAPWDVKHLVDKADQAVDGEAPVTICERGASFGYNRLVSDMTALPIMRSECRVPIVFDGTHSVQQPGGLGGRSGGNRDLAPVLIRAACAAGIDGLFMEVHDNPDEALSDGPNQVRLSDLESVLRDAVAVREALRSRV